LSVRLGIAYHMPFWQTADGALWEAEGSFARYVDSLAPYFDEVLLAVPVFDTPPVSGTRVQAANVRLYPLPYYPGPKQFIPLLPRINALLRAWVEQCDLINLRVPTPSGYFAYRHARKLGKPIFLLVVGDYQALVPHLGYRGAKHALFSFYVRFEEWALRRMIRTALTFTNGGALHEKHASHGPRVHETKTSTLRLEDVATRVDTCGSSPIRLLTVSRIDPRKGLRTLPAAVAALVEDRVDVTLDLVGPSIGQPGDEERAALLAEAKRLGVSDRVHLRGAVPLDQLMADYQRYDIFVLPTRPGEGIPRVLLEAMAAGLPVVTTRVSGIASLIAHGENGLLVDHPDPVEVARAVKRVIESPVFRRTLIQRAYETARAHTAERQAAAMMAVVRSAFPLPLRTPAVGVA
jgi:glycosyltransferase involved in cell wall biosynthesis